MNIFKSLFGKTEPIQTVNMPNMNAKQEQEFSAFRQLVGDPYQQTPEMFVRKVVANSPAIDGKPRFLASHVQLYTRIIADLGFDEYDLTEMSMWLEDFYGKEMNFPDWSPEEMSQVTVSDLVEIVRKHI